MKRTLKALLILLILTLLFSGCMKKTLDNQGKKDLALCELGEEGDIRKDNVAYDILDMRVFGFWSLTLKKDQLASKLSKKSNYAYQTKGRVYKLTENPYNHNILEVLLPTALTESEIKNGLLQGLESPLDMSAAREDGITIEKIIIQGTETKNGIDLYEIGVQNYISMRSDDQSLVYNGKDFIRPSYVNSSELNVYPVNTFFDARAVSENKTVNSAFVFLKGRDDHETLLSFIHPNRVREEEGEVIIDKPDERDKYRQLGSMGALSEGNAYNIVDDPNDDQTILSFKRDKLPQEYEGADYFETEFKGGMIYEFSESETAGIYEAAIPYSQTENIELIKNTRFNTNPFNGGQGTKDDPFRIVDWEQLNSVRDFLDYHFVLVNDLNSETTGYATYASTEANEEKGWKPIGPFTGTLDGDGYTIAHLITIGNSVDNVGLFGSTNGASLSNFEINGCNITGQFYVGSVVGRATSTTISDIALKEIYVNGFMSVGGVVGWFGTSSEAINIEANGTVTSDHFNCGGLFGISYESTISSCHFGGAVKAKGNAGSTVGGLVGSDEESTIQDSFATGTVDAPGITEVGGFIGLAYKTKIENCYTTADATGDEKTGGFVGQFSSAAITNAYSTGQVTGNDDTGGFCGLMENGGSITGCFWDSETSGTDTTAGDAASKTTAEMKTLSTFTEAGWNEPNTIWATTTHAGCSSYPYLKNNPQTPAPGYESHFAGGDGTAGSPFEIENWEHLNNVRNYLDKHFELIATLDSDTEYYDNYASSTANGGEGWEPIGVDGSGFIGTLDGNERAIDDLNITKSSDYIGLFGVTNGASLSNFEMNGCDITGGNYVGSVVGRANSTTISDITLKGINVNGYEYVGGVAGRFETSSEAENIVANGTVTSDDSYCGGLFGETYNSTITSSHFGGAVKKEGSLVGYSFGGLVGYDKGSTIEESFATGTVDAPNSRRVGGFIGSTDEEDTIIENCYTTADVTGAYHIGGFVGLLSAAITNAYSTGQVSGSNVTGGFCGTIRSGASIKNAYSTGQVTESTNTGGFCGNMSGGSITDCFWDSETSGTDTTAGDAASKTTAEMKSAGTFGDWNHFTSTWSVEPETGYKSYPYLKNNPQTPAPGKEEREFAGGCGTVGDPYQIANWKQLNNVRDHLDAHFVLNNDFDSNTADYEIYNSIPGGTVLVVSSFH